MSGSGGSSRDHEAANHDQDDGAVRVEATLADSDDAPPLACPGLACIQNLAVRVKRVALEERVRQLDLVPPERKSVLACVRDHQAGHDPDGEDAVHEGPLELRLGGVVRIDVDRVLVVRQQREPDVVGLGNGAAGERAIDVADLEVFENGLRSRADANVRARDHDATIVRTHPT